MPIKARYWKNPEKARQDWQKYGKPWRRRKRLADPEWAKKELERLLSLPTKIRHTKIRYEVFKRDNFTCQYCGRKAPDVQLNTDHVIAKSKGGKYTMDNLKTTCIECNIGKSDR